MATLAGRSVRLTQARLDSAAIRFARGGRSVDADASSCADDPRRVVYESLAAKLLETPLG